MVENEFRVGWHETVKNAQEKLPSYKKEYDGSSNEDDSKMQSSY